MNEKKAKKNEKNPTIMKNNEAAAAHGMGMRMRMRMEFSLCTFFESLRVAFSFLDLENEKKSIKS